MKSYKKWVIFIVAAGILAVGGMKTVQLDNLFFAEEVATEATSESEAVNQLAVEAVHSANLFDWYAASYGSAMDTTGEIKADSEAFYTAPITVTTGQSVVVMNRSGGKVPIQGIVVFNNYGTVLEAATEPSTNIYPISSLDAATAVITLGIDTQPEDIMIYTTNRPSEAVAFEEYAYETQAVSLREKEVWVFGDSIMYGAGTEGNGIAYYLGERNDMTYKNFAIPGYTLTVRTKYQKDVLVQLKAAKEAGGSPDYIVWNGGTNDVADGYTAPIGSITEEGVTVFDAATVYGAAEQVCHYMKEQWPEAQIVYVVSHKMDTRSLSKQIAAWNAMHIVCSKWDITIVDLFKNSGLDTFDDKAKDLFTAVTTDSGHGDGTHPNELGYETYYLPLIEEAMRWQRI